MPEKPRVILAPHPRTVARVFASADLARLSAMAEVVWGQDEPMPQAAFEEALPEAVAIVHGAWTFGGEEVLRRAGRLRAIMEIMGGHGKPGFPYDYCFAHQIRVLSCSPAFGQQVAELALALALAGARDVASADRVFRAGTETYQMAGNQGTFLLRDKPVGIVGLGAIARALLPLLTPFHCQVLAYDPWLPDNMIRGAGCEPLPLEDLLARARVIFVLAVPTSENRALIGRERLALIQRDAVFVLMSRAHLVDFDALTECVLEGRFRAAIDVFPREPLPLEHPIRRAEGAILSAHRAGSVEEGHQEIGRMVTDDLGLILRGLPPRLMLRAEPELVARTAPRR